MQISIRHTTSYGYDEPVPYGLTQVRLVPRSGRSQTVERWDVDVEGASRQVRFEDHHRNIVELYATDPEADALVVSVSGAVTTIDSAGVTAHDNLAPLWLYLRSTRLTEPGAGIRKLTAGVTPDAAVEQLHDLSARVLGAVTYEIGRTHAGSTAEEALTDGAGVCQDHAHIFIGCCREAGIPARYVSGYLLLDDADHAGASHAWAEASVPGLGWVGFDVSNGISPDERYVRIAAGLDYDDVAPITGVRHGSSAESMNVDIEVREAPGFQQQQQQQHHQLQQQRQERER